MVYDTILFDMDGTLLESAVGIIAGLEFALAKMGIENPDTMILRKFIGPPLPQSFERYFHFSAVEVQEASKHFKTYYEREGKFQNRLYTGIPELLLALSEAGKRCFVATSKPELTAREITDFYGISQYFERVVGANYANGSRVTKSSVILSVLTEYGTARNPVMIGDTVFDINGAKQNQLDSIGVLYGYGSRDELEKAGASQIVRNVEELREILLESD